MTMSSTSHTMASADKYHNNDTDVVATIPLATSTTGVDRGRARQQHTSTSTYTSTVPLCHMPNSIIIEILSCLPTLDMIRIRPTCQILNECSMNGHAWRYSMNKIDEEYK